MTQNSIWITVECAHCRHTVKAPFATYPNDFAAVRISARDFINLTGPVEFIQCTNCLSVFADVGFLVIVPGRGERT